jgi:transitional endoplasmic reticulum ATPase
LKNTDRRINMNQIDINKNRVLKNIDSLFNKGKNIFIITGVYVNDQFFLNFQYGLLSVSDCIKKYLKNKRNIYELLHIEDQKIIEGAIQQKTKYDEYAAFLDSNQNEKKNRQSNDNENLDENSKQGIINMIKKFSSKKNSAGKRAVILEDFDWMAGFYNDNREHTSEYFRQIKDLSNDKDCYIFLIQRNTKVFPEYNYDMDAENVITLGKPSAEEIYCTFLTQYFKKYYNRTISNLKPLNDIMYAISANTISNNEFVKILDEKMLPPNSEITTAIFKDSVTTSIEETVKESDVIINNDVKQSLKELVNQFLNEKNSDFQKGFLMSGPPGTGKTHIARWLANENKCYFMTPKLSDIKGQFIGESVQKVKALFNEARSNAPTIMFVDEIDTVLPKRDSGHSDSFTKDIVNEFLQSIDGAGTQKDRIMIIGATNRPYAVDNAILSRISKQIEITLPNKQSRREIFKLLLKNKTVIKQDTWYDEFLERTEGFSGRDIKEFCLSFQDEKILGKNEFYLKLSEWEKKYLKNLSENSEGLEIKVFGEHLIKNFDDIIGYEKIKSDIDSRISVCLEADEHKKQRAKKLKILSEGLLFYGPAGTGKTLFAEAIAGKFELHFIKVLSKDILRNSVDATNREIENIFHSASKISKITSKDSRAKGVVLFFDEFDAIAGKDVQDPRIRGTLLDNLTKYRNESDNMIIVAATNFYERLDEASKREGRFDDHIKIEEMNQETTEKVIEDIISNDNKKHQIRLIPQQFLDYCKKHKKEGKDTYSFAEIEKHFKDFKRDLYHKGELQ